MKICFLSDTHGQHRSKRLILPEADAICHTGDFSPRGKTEDVVEFMRWFTTLPYKYKIFIAGNHDWGLFDHEDIMLEYLPENVTYLKDSSITIEGIKFYGTPWQPIFLDWAFNLTEEELVHKYAMIPNDTDVLLTHCPPYGVLDTCLYDGKIAGSPSLLNRILEINPIVSAFGHIHEQYGEISLYNNTTFVNGSVLNRRYELVNDPIIVNVVK